jgi:hypothetical protein
MPAPTPAPAPARKPEDRKFRKLMKQLIGVREEMKGMKKMVKQNLMATSRVEGKVNALMNESTFYLYDLTTGNDPSGTVFINFMTINDGVTDLNYDQHLVGVIINGVQTYNFDLRINEPFNGESIVNLNNSEGNIINTNDIKSLYFVSGQSQFMYTKP